MKRIVCIFLFFLCIFTLFSCHDPDISDGEVDLDLTKLSSTMVYSEVYNMVETPENYIGRRVRMQGKFSVYRDPSTDAVYFACVIADATACCSQGVEFVLEGTHAYPDDYPPLGTEITVTGEFSTYTENGIRYCYLTGATLG